MDEIGTYGHFGHAVYDRDEKAWSFQRSVEASPIFQVLTESQNIIESSTGESDAGFGEDGKEGPSRRRENQVKGLIKLHPEVQPAGTLLKDLLRTSEAVEESSARHDPIKGNLLALGIIQDTLTKSRTEVVAFPTRSNGSDLRLVQIQNQRRGWRDVKSTHLQVPTLHGEDATWNGPGVSIQSIVFANPLQGYENFLAVRLITQIVIFRPVLQNAPAQGGSRLDMNLLVAVDMEQTGDQPYADVAFNPWFSRQMAVLDQRGRCTVLALVGKPPERVKQVARSEPMKDLERRSHLQDCWGRVSWISEPSMVAVCTRRNLKVFTIADKELEELHDIDVGLGDVGWILDMAVPSSHADHILVVTSHHLIVYHVNKHSASKVVMVRHFREADDISLRVKFCDEGDDQLLLIRSSFSPTVVIYRLRFSDESIVTISDPMEMFVPSPHNETTAPVLSLHLAPVEMKGDIHDVGNGHEPSYNLFNARFAQLTTLHKNFSVAQALYIVSTHAQLASTLGPPTRNIKLKKMFYQELDDDFIVDDQDEELQQGGILCEPISNFGKRMALPCNAIAGDWTINYEHIARKLNATDVAGATGLHEAIEVVEDILKDEASDKYLPFQTLKDVIDREVILQNLESASTALQRLAPRYTSRESGHAFEDEMEDEQQDGALFLQSITPLPFLDFTNTSLTDLLTRTYENLSEPWIRRASDNMSELERHAKDQVAFRTAAEIAFASILVRPRERETEQLPVPVPEPQSNSNVWELPVRPGAPLSARSTPSVYLDAPSQPQSPRSPHLATPSETGSSASTRVGNFALTRLSRYTSFASTPKPASLSKRLNRVLSHWTVGEDPAIYDWSALSRHFSRREEEEAQDEELTEKERLRQQRRTERYVRRQQREAEETARMQLLSSQAPAILTSSQPARGGSQQIGLVGDGQSQGQSQGRMAASQVLPGRHGGRPAKKKRKQGF